MTEQDKDLALLGAKETIRELQSENRILRDRYDSLLEAVQRLGRRDDWFNQASPGTAGVPAASGGSPK